jgi:glycosyltransferase involved in cell wall biosynthesis
MIPNERIEKISVIMPSYNTEKYIGEAIESILNQTYPYFELLICDDGSTDKTYEIAKQYASRDSRIKLFRNKKNIGNLKTTNFLFSQCNGDYIAIQDSDDFSYPNRLHKQYCAFKDEKSLGLIGSNYCITDDSLVPFSCGLVPQTDFEIKKKMNHEVPQILYGSIMFRKAFLEIINGFLPIFDRKGYADLDFICRICEMTKVKNLPEILYLYRKHDIHQNSPNTIIGKHGLELIIEAHKQRASGQIDFLKSKNFFKIRKYVGSLYRIKGDQNYWNQDLKEAQRNFITSLYYFPFNVYILKSLLKMFFKIKL